MKYELIIWDWNGTLLNDTKLNFQVIQAILEKYSQPSISFDYFQSNLRFPLNTFYEEIGLIKPGDDFIHLEQDFYDHYDHKVLTHADLHDPIRDLLQIASDLSMQQSILSARMHDSLVKEVNHFGINHHFQYVQGSQPGMSYKGKESYAHQIIGDIEPSSAVIIGDTVHDYEVAQAIGADCFLVAKGLNTKEMLSECDTPVLDHHEELMDLLF